MVRSVITHGVRQATPPLLSFCRDLKKRSLILNSVPLFHQDLDKNIESTETIQPIASLPNVLYAGFDPTADSLHIGHLVIISNLIRSSIYGCQPIALIGRATAMVGDPSGRDEDRKQLSQEEVCENSKNILKQLVEILENSQNFLGEKASLTILNNLDWYEKIPVVDFLAMTRGVRIGEMLRLGAVKARMERKDNNGISFTEFSYQLLQSYDWYTLAKQHNCLFQVGGSDQLGNMQCGRDFIRTEDKRFTAGICFPLLTDEYGAKLGKSTIPNLGCSATSRSIWLDEKKTSPYMFYQYFRQLHDDVAEKFLRYLSQRKLEEVDEIIREHREKLGQWIAQTYLADEMTQLVHGQSGLETASTCSNILFKGRLEDLEKLDSETISSLFGPSSTVVVPKHTIKKVGQLADATKLFNTKQRGSIVMADGGFHVNGKEITDPNKKFCVDEYLIKNEFTVVRWGKRKYFLVQWA